MDLSSPISVNICHPIGPTARLATRQNPIRAHSSHADAQQSSGVLIAPVCLRFVFWLGQRWPWMEVGGNTAGVVYDYARRA